MCTLMASSMRLLKLKLFRAMDTPAHCKLGRRRRTKIMSVKEKNQGKKKPGF